MMRRTILALACAFVMVAGFSATSGQAQERDNGRVWGGQYSNPDFGRCYLPLLASDPSDICHYHCNRNGEILYVSQPPEKLAPVNYRTWNSYYPKERRYHPGHTFVLDVF